MAYISLMQIYVDCFEHIGVIQMDYASKVGEILPLLTDMAGAT